MRGRRTARRQQSADAGDADGIDALLSLANVAQDQANFDQQESGASMDRVMRGRLLQIAPVLPGSSFVLKD